MSHPLKDFLETKEVKYLIEKFHLVEQNNIITISINDMTFKTMNISNINFAKKVMEYTTIVDHMIKITKEESTNIEQVFKKFLFNRYAFGILMITIFKAENSEITKLFREWNINEIKEVFLEEYKRIYELMMVILYIFVISFYNILINIQNKDKKTLLDIKMNNKLSVIEFENYMENFIFNSINNFPTLINEEKKEFDLTYMDPINKQVI